MFAQTSLVGQRRHRALRRRLHLRHPRPRRGHVRAALPPGARREPPLRAVGRARLRRARGDRRRARQAAQERRDVRLHVARRDRRGGRPGHDHELQRVARGHADRACEPAARLRRATPARGASRACGPRPPTSTRTSVLGAAVLRAAAGARAERRRTPVSFGHRRIRRPRAARAAPERADARAARPRSRSSSCCSCAADDGYSWPAGDRLRRRRRSPTRSTASSRAAGTSSPSSARSPTRSPTG